MAIFNKNLKVTTLEIGDGINKTGSLDFPDTNAGTVRKIKTFLIDIRDKNNPEIIDQSKIEQIIAADDKDQILLSCAAIKDFITALIDENIKL